LFFALQITRGDHSMYRISRALHKKLDSTEVSNVIKNGKEVNPQCQKSMFSDIWFAISFHEPIQKKISIDKM
jgi:hypothetical protein